MSICRSPSVGKETPAPDEPLRLKSIQTCAAEVESCVRTLRRMPEVKAMLVRVGNRDFLDARFWENHKQTLICRGLEKRTAA